MTLAVEAVALLIAGASLPVAGRGLVRAVRSGRCWPAQPP